MKSIFLNLLIVIGFAIMLLIPPIITLLFCGIGVFVMKCFEAKDWRRETFPVPEEEANMSAGAGRVLQVGDPRHPYYERWKQELPK